MATATQSVLEIAFSEASAAAVFQRFEIDLNIHGEHSLAQACAELQLSVEQVLDKLASAQANMIGAQAADPSSLSTERLIQHIVRTHHQRARRELPVLAAQSDRLVTGRDGTGHNLRTICSLVHQFEEEMFAHLEKEEDILFPFIAYLSQQLCVGRPIASSGFDTIHQPIQMMLLEHHESSHLLTRLRGLTQDFEMREGGSESFHLFCAGLRAFETDLLQHIHLEDDVLFPRATALESAAAL